MKRAYTTLLLELVESGLYPDLAAKVPEVRILSSIQELPSEGQSGKWAMDLRLDPDEADDGNVAVPGGAMGMAPGAVGLGVVAMASPAAALGGA